MQVVTYLFGAGASCPQLPVVKSWPSKLQEFAEYIRGLKDLDAQDGKGGFPERLSVVQNAMDQEISWILKESGGRLTVDELAKRAYDTEPTGRALKSLKCLIMTFIGYYQSFRRTGANRYDEFLIRIMKRVDQEINLPDNIRILTWNYDTEIEASIGRNYANLSETPEEFLQSHPHRIGTQSFQKDKPSLFHLNGVSNLVYTVTDTDKTLRTATTSDGEVDRLKETVGLYRAINFDDRYQPVINFAFEDDPFVDKQLERVLSAIADTSVLVVIGYSFPYFNGEMDGALLRNMPGLKKIYIQDFAEAIPGIESSIKDLLPEGRTVDFRHESRLDSFVIPKELREQPS